MTDADASTLDENFMDATASISNREQLAWWVPTCQSLV